MIGHEQVGAIEILRLRVYPLDPAATDDGNRTTVCVSPGIYPVYRDFEAYYWLMTGQINNRGFHKLGDGLFSIVEGDDPAGPLVTFPSPRFGPAALAELLTEDGFTEGHPEQRCRVLLDTPLPA